MSACCCVLAVSGYVAAIEWRSVQVERPRACTSGGQSEGTEGTVEVGVEAWVEDDVAELDGVEVAALFCFVMASQEDTSVQVRQLGSIGQSKSVMAFYQGGAWVAYGLPSLSRTTPLGSGALESSWDWFAPAAVLKDAKSGLPVLWVLNGSWVVSAITNAAIEYSLGRGEW